MADESEEMAMHELGNEDDDLESLNVGSTPDSDDDSSEKRGANRYLF